MKGLRVAASVIVLSGLLAGCASSAAPPPKVKSVPFVTVARFSTGSPMNPFNANPLQWTGMDVMPLAFSKNQPNPAAFWPGLASHWKASRQGTSVTVWLQPHAKWSNGKPVAAQDIKVTVACEFAVGLGQAAGLATTNGFKMLGPGEVQFNQAPGVHSNIFLRQVLLQRIVPASVYGPLLPPNIWTLIQSSGYTGTNPAKMKAAKSATTALTALGTTISSYAPASDLASGPFYIKSSNPGEVVMAKNPYYFDASKIGIPEVILRTLPSSEVLYNYLISGQVDEAAGSLPANIVQKANTTAGNHLFKVPVYVLVSLLFGENHYPYNLTAVRQALAYVVDPRSVQSVSDPVAATVSQWNDGMTDTVTRTYLTASERATLIHYTVNPQKATALLDAAGFHKVNGVWMLPNGKPWTATVNTASTYSVFVEAAGVVAHEMTAFGIPTKTKPVPIPQLIASQKAGAFGISLFNDGYGPDPYFAMSTLYGLNDGYVAVNGHLIRRSAGDWIHFPAAVTLPGGVSVDAGAMTNQLILTQNPSTFRADVYRLAQVTNRYLPTITLMNGLVTGYVNTQHFTDYPIANSAVMQGTAVLYPPIGVWLTLGYVHPKP